MEQGDLANYSVRVVWSADDDGFLALCDEFPELSAFGETRRKALREFDVALGLLIEAYQAEGRPLPAPKEAVRYSGQFRVRVPKALHARLAAEAEAQSVSLNTLVNTYLSYSLGASTQPSEFRYRQDEESQFLVAERAPRRSRRQ